MSFLTHVGNVFKQILGIAITVAKDTEPVADIALTAAGLGGLVQMYNTGIGLAVGAEAMAPSLTGTGPQKLAQLVASLTPQAIAWAAQNGVVWPADQITKWASAVVDTINLIPAPTAPVVPAVKTA